MVLAIKSSQLQNTNPTEDTVLEENVQIQVYMLNANLTRVGVRVPIAFRCAGCIKTINTLRVNS